MHKKFREATSRRRDFRPGDFKKTLYRIEVVLYGVDADAEHVGDFLSVQVRHDEVHENDVRSLLFGEAHAHDQMIVCQQNPYLLLLIHGRHL